MSPLFDQGRDNLEFNIIPSLYFLYVCSFMCDFQNFFIPTSLLCISFIHLANFPVQDFTLNLL